MKARIRKSGEIKNFYPTKQIGYDGYIDEDDNFYYPSELDFTLSEPEEEVTIEGWVARDEDGCLNLFNGEPERIADCVWGIYLGDLGLGLPKEYFPDLKWSDPIKVTITIKPKKK